MLGRLVSLSEKTDGREFHEKNGYDLSLDFVDGTNWQFEDLPVLLKNWGKLDYVLVDDQYMAHYVSQLCSANIVTVTK